MRTFEAESANGNTAKVMIDSGWNRDEVRLDIQTTRGKVVELTVAQWYELVCHVQKILEHCENQRTKKVG